MDRRAGRRLQPARVLRRLQDGHGIVIVNGWESEAAHQAFAHRMGPHLEAVGMGMPDHLEHLWIEKLGWD